ncbi:MAG TPA: hypothetical protein VIX12_00775 [Candidatus Binataceae bacterium]
MALFNAAGVIAAANTDDEFQIAARLWNADVRLEVGANAYVLRMRDGRIAEFAPLEAAQAAAKFDVRISAPDSDWRELLRPVPKPFYQDLMAAMSRQSFRLEGDLVGFYPYYRATNRLFELMRNAPAS